EVPAGEDARKNWADLGLFGDHRGRQVPSRPDGCDAHRPAEPRSDADDQAQLAPAARGLNRGLPLPGPGVPTRGAGGRVTPKRDWQPERFADAQFLSLVPPEKWYYFSGLVCPLADSAATVVWNTLFAGVGRPFHFKLAKGWMGEVFRRVRDRPSDIQPVKSV